MADQIIVKTGSSEVMGNVLVWVMRYARAHPENFTIGPFDTKAVIKNGLELAGDIGPITTALKLNFGSMVMISDA